jgi:Icc-related predicted phosphoesterase
MLIDCISDLHGFLPDLNGGDILLIAGDLTGRDTKQEYEQFVSWLGKQPYRCKVVIAGNHDGLIEKGIVKIGADEHNIHYLCDSSLEFEGVKIWGSPYTPTFFRWHFMRDRGADIKKHWDLIPSNIDILVTHGPPQSILDENDHHLHVGCEDLRKAVQDQVRPRLHCFGHIHEEGGKITKIDGTTYANCSFVNVDYQPVNSAIRLVFEDL